MTERTLNFIEACLKRWMLFASRRPYWIIGVISVAAIIGGILAALFIGVDSDTSRMVSSKLDYRKANLELIDAFPNQETDITLIIRGRTQDETDAFTLEIIEELKVRTDAVVDVFSQISDPFFQQNGLLFLDWDDLDQTLPRISEAAPLIRRLGRNPNMSDLYASLLVATEGVEADQPLPEAIDRALNNVATAMEAALAGRAEPMSWQALFDGDESDLPFQQIVSISPVLDYSKLQPARPAVIAVNEIVDQLETNGGFDVTADITGNVALRMEELNAVRDGIGLALLTSLALVTIILFAAFRSARLVATCLFALIVSIMITLGFAAVAFGDLNLVSVAFAVLLVGLGIDFSVHLALHVQEERRIGADASEALGHAAKHIGGALVLCAPTSALAFFAFAPTKFIGMAQLGIISGVGVIVAFVVAVSILPAMFALMPQVLIETEGGEGSAPGKQNDEKVGGNQRLLAMGILVLGVLGLTQLPSVRFNADPMALRDVNAPTVLAFDLLFDDPDTQPFTLSILEETEEGAEATVAKLEGLPTVKRAFTLSKFIPEDQLDKLDVIEIAAFNLEFAFDDLEAPREVPDADLQSKLLTRMIDINSEGSLQFAKAMTAVKHAALSDTDLEARVLENVFTFWPLQLDRLEQQLQASEFSSEDLPELLRGRFLSENTGQLRVQIEPEQDLRSDAARVDFVDEVRAADNRAAGSARSVLQSGRVISQAMVTAILFALVAVSILLLAILRDVKLVVIILFCLCLAGVLTVATSVLFGMSFNFANIIVLPLIIGVGADSGIHLGLRMMKKEDQENIYSTSTPRAVFVSAITTIATFGTLSFSAHRGVSSMGLLLAIAIMFTLLCTVIVQPWLIEKFVLREEKRV